MADDTYSTDQIVEVYEHLVRNDKSWLACVADHGLDPILSNRALKVLFGEGEGNVAKVGVQAFVLGLQFGAMRLDPVEFDPELERPCECLFCQMRRAAEAGQPGEEGGSEGGGS